MDTVYEIHSTVYFMSSMKSQYMDTVFHLPWNSVSHSTVGFHSSMKYTVLWDTQFHEIDSTVGFHGILCIPWDTVYFHGYSVSYGTVYFMELCIQNNDGTVVFHGTHVSSTMGYCV